MTSSPPKADDVCEVCGEVRELHGDKNHEFSLDGVLRTKKQAPPPRNAPPAERGTSAPAQALANDPVARLQIRLIEKLVAKGLLDGDDLMYVFGGDVSH